MSADLDRLLAWGDRRPITHWEPDPWIPVSVDTIRRIAADYAQVVAERDQLRSLDRFIEETDALVADRDRWRAIADRLAAIIQNEVGFISDGDEAQAALDAWRAAKES